MPSHPDDAGRGPPADAASDESALLARVEREVVDPAENELAEAFSALAALLLDFRAVGEREVDRGSLPTPHKSATNRPDAARRSGLAPPPLGDAA